MIKVKRKSSVLRAICTYNLNTVRTHVFHSTVHQCSVKNSVLFVINNFGNF